MSVLKAEKGGLKTGQAAPVFEADEKDLALLAALRENAKQSVFQLARKTRIPPTTIHNRLKKLRSRGVIQKYTVRLDRKKMGLNVCGLVFLFVENTQLEPSSRKGGLARGLMRYPQVEEVFETTGSIDVIVKVHARNVEELTEFVINHLREIPGVKRTETVIALSELMR